MPAILDRHDTEKLVGTFRRLGAFGPAYEILAFRVEGDHQVADIEVPETGEKTTISVEEVLSDPLAD